MLKSPLATALVLALASPLALANDPPATARPAAQTHHAQSTSDRQAAKQLTATGSATVTLGADRPAVRDWAAIDTNKDNLISPEEMQKHLQQQWAASRK